MQENKDKLVQFAKNNKRALTIAAGLVAFYLAMRTYFKGGVCRVNRDLKGQTIVLTGGSTGIGKQTLKELASKGCMIIFGARDKNKSDQVVRDLLKEFMNCQVIYYPLDLSDKMSIEQFAKKVKDTTNRIDILINNAGVSMPTRRQTRDHFQMTMGVNHLGHFYLTHLLWSRIKAVQRPRIINVSSLAHKGMGRHKNVTLDFNDINYRNDKYDSDLFYSRSKLANILFTRQLQLKMDNAGIRGLALSLHPGVIWTELARQYDWKTSVKLAIMSPFIALCCKRADEGAQTTLYLVLQDHDKLIKGEYYADCQVSQSSPFSKDMNNADKLWKASEELLEVKFDV